MKRRPLYASPYGGRKYHRFPHCNGLNATALAMCGLGEWTITRAEAVQRGLTPCVLCKPPPLLMAVG